MGSDKIPFNETSISLNVGDFEKLEALIECSLPDDLRDFYLKNNGGFPNDNTHYFDENKYTDIFFHPILYKNSEHGLTVERAWKLDFGFGMEFQKRCIPIGTDGTSGDGIYYSLDQNDFGHIFLYNHDTAFENLTYLSTSLSSFLSNLKEHPVDAS